MDSGLDAALGMPEDTALAVGCCRFRCMYTGSPHKRRCCPGADSPAGVPGRRAPPPGRNTHPQTVLEIPRENTVLLHQTAVVKVFQFRQRLLDGLLEQVPVQAHQAVQKHRVQQRTGAVHPVQVGGVDVGVAHLGE